jgi:hypothetical protein
VFGSLVIVSNTSRSLGRQLFDVTRSDRIDKQMMAKAGMLLFIFVINGIATAFVYLSSCLARECNRLTRSLSGLVDVDAQVRCRARRKHQLLSSAFAFAFAFEAMPPCQ